MFAFLQCLLNICRKLEFLISKGSVATCLRCGGYCYMSFVANFIRLPAVQKFWKSVKIWHSCREFKGGNFFETRCTYLLTYLLDCTEIVQWVCCFHILRMLAAGRAFCPIPSGSIVSLTFSARCFHRTNRHAIATMSVRPSVCVGRVCIVIRRCTLAPV